MVLGGGGYNLGSAYGSIVIDSSGVSAGIRQAQRDLQSGLQAISSTVSGLGQSLTTVFTPISLALGKATKDAIDFNEAVTNIQAVTGASADEAKRLGDQLLIIGQNSRYGPQAVAEAFYDIAGGVTDASVRMATLNAAVKTAEAGNADLGGTTKALISIMNGYGFSAQDAQYASDVLVQTVNKGVGTMDDFAAALPNVAGLANSLGISFSDLGSETAYLTTKGVSATEASTQLSAMMRALLTPSKNMQTALKKIGFESGTAAIKQLGLVGTFQKLKDSGADIPDITGRIEGLRGAIALTDGGFQQFSTDFNSGLDGITDRTQQIQDNSPAAQMDMFNSTISTLSITIGQTLIPVLNQMLATVKPIIDQIIAWIQQNPELAGQIGMVIAALGTLGPILIVVGAALGAIGTIIGIILSPFGLIVAAIVGLYAAFQSNFLGIRDFLQPIIDNFVIGFNTLQGVLQNFSNLVNTKGVGMALMSVVNAFAQMLGLVQNDQMSPFLQSLGDAINKLGSLQNILSTATTAAQQLVNMGLLLLMDTLSQASTSAQNLVNMGLLLLVDTINRASISAQNIVTIVQNWITNNASLIQHIINLAAAFFAAQGLIAAFNGASVAITAVKAAIEGAKLGISGISALITGALSPVVVLTAAIWALVEAYQAVQKFQNQAQVAIQGANQALAPQIQSGQITRQQYMDASFQAQTQAFGGGFGGDLMARLLQQFAGWNVIMNAPYDQNHPSGDFTGIHSSGMSYLVGRGAQPQLFTPKSDMMGIPNIDKLLGGGGGDTFNVSIVLPDSAIGNPGAAREAGRLAADSFEQRILDKRRSRA